MKLSTRPSGRASAQVLRLVPRTQAPGADRQTVDLAEALLTGARSGRIDGAAIVISNAHGGYAVHVVGRFRRATTFARGAVGALEDELRELVQNAAYSAPSVDLL